MKLKCRLTLIITVGFAFQIYAQNDPGKISGVIIDSQNKMLPGATIVLYPVADTASQQIRVSDKKGSFVFDQLPYNTYVVIISSIGFKPYRYGHLTLNESHAAIVLPVVVLQVAGQTLKEVSIMAKKPLIEQKTDRTIVNVDAMLSAAGSNALEALSKSPGVIVDANDNISLNGKSNVLVLIDDRPTYMSGQDLAAYLRSLPAGTLDKLELISNPPARYDASGGAVINIVLKKNHTSGFNGALNIGYNQGVYARSNDALNINCRTSKFNIFSNISYGHDQNFSSETYSRYFYNSNGSLNSAALQNSRYSYSSDGWNGRIGIDYFINPKTTLGFMLTGGSRPKTEMLTFSNDQYNGNMQLDSSGIGYTSGKYQWKNAGINLNMQHKFDNQGTQLSADLDYVHFYSDADQYSPVYTYKADGSPANNERRIFLLPAKVNIYSGKADFDHPFSGKGEFDAGIKSSYVNNDNHLDWLNQVDNTLIPDYSNSNHFSFTENINSAYVNLRKGWGRWGMQAGLRAEHTNSEGHQFNNPAIPDSSFKKSYTNLFPSLYISYKLDTGGSTLALSYNKRIRRPGYQQLNPFLFYHDQYSYTSGNPNLVPYFNQYYELKYSYRQFIGITTGYGVGNNEIQSLTQATGNIFITRPDNFINNRTYSFIPYFSMEPTHWWTFQFNAVLLYLLNNGGSGDVVVKQKANVHEIEISNELQLGKTWSAELEGFFPGKQTFGQSQSDKAVYNISGGIRKSILHEQGAISLSFNDIFHTFYKSYNQTIDINQVSAFSTRETDSRRIGLSFIYRFGKAANARKRNNTGSAEDEKSRTN